MRRITLYAMHGNEGSARATRRIILLKLAFLKFDLAGFEKRDASMDIVAVPCSFWLERAVRTG